MEAVEHFQTAVSKSDVCVTCTPSKVPFLGATSIAPGTFIAAVGADNPEKQELEPTILSRNKVVTDLLEQCATIGELHHAIDARLMTREDVHCELGEVIAGTRTGRTSNDEIIIFDSTGMALQDRCDSGSGVRESCCRRCRQKNRFCKLMVFVIESGGVGGWIMNALLTDQVRLLILIGSCGLLWSVESIVPLYRYQHSRVRHALPNVALTLMLVLTNLALSFFSAYLAAFTVHYGVGIFFLCIRRYGFEQLLAYWFWTSSLISRTSCCTNPGWGGSFIGCIIRKAQLT